MSVPAAIGLGGLGLVKGLTTDRWKEDRGRWLASQTQRYSPWTGLRAQPFQEADPLGSMVQGGLSGAALGGGDMGDFSLNDKTMVEGAGPTNEALAAQEASMNPYTRQRSQYLADMGKKPASMDYTGESPYLKYLKGGSY